MKISVSRHIFGSIRGYTTLAKSKDLSSEETTTLEILSFGQTNESSYLDSLQTNPAYISRPFHPGKWAVTRVFKGKTDEHNRITLLFISAVITIDDWLYSLKCDVNKLLYYPGLWQWNGEEQLEPIEITVESKMEIPGPEIRNKVLSLLGAVEKYTVEENTTIVVRASDYNAKVHRWLNMVLPLSSKQTFSCTARSLNDGLPFSLISMAKEGSFGNSRRRTVNWTLTSSVDNCPYTEALTQFWRHGKQPPWQFIDSCKSFLTDMREELEPLPQKRLARQKTYFSRKLAIILLTCAVVAGLATVITVVAMRFKAKKENTSFIEGRIREAKVFLEQNSPREYFPADNTARKQAIEKGENLKYQLEGSLERADNPEHKVQLKTISSNLDNWLNLANDVHQRYGLLNSRMQQVERLKLRIKPNLYPVRVKIEGVDELRESITNIEKTKLAPDYVSKAQEIQHNIDEWQNAIGKLLNREKDKVTLFIRDLPEIPPKNYSVKQYEEYNSYKRKLNEFREDESLTNAKDSPIKKHQEIAKGAIAELDTALADCNNTLQTMDGFKKEAESSFNDANDILDVPNITDGAIDNFAKLKDAQSHLDKVAKLWPDKPNLKEKTKEAESKFETNKNETLRIWDERIQRINKDADPNAAPIKELLEQYDTEKIKLEGYKIQDINENLQQFKKFDEKLRTQLSSISKPKKKESKHNK